VELARRHPDWTVVGIDTNEEMLRRANERAEQAGLENVVFERKDVTASLGSRSYDAVLAIQVLEEVFDDAAAFRSLADALRPDGIFLADVPERAWAPVLPGSEPTWRYEVRHGYEAEEIRDTLARFGLAVERITPSSRGTIRLAQEIRDRVKTQSIRVRAFVHVSLAPAVPLERFGLTWGRPRSLFIEARRKESR
jgi:SAM-dependent methyltransferase